MAVSFIGRVNRRRPRTCRKLLLRFVGITFQDAGNYTCSATNFVGTTTSQIITVKVNGGKLINTFLVVFIRPSWSYGSWIYNYQCNQCLSQLTLRFLGRVNRRRPRKCRKLLTHFITQCFIKYTSFVRDSKSQR
jgi:hypothetical protein